MQFPIRLKSKTTKTDKRPKATSLQQYGLQDLNTPALFKSERVLKAFDHEHANNDHHRLYWIAFLNNASQYMEQCAEMPPPQLSDHEAASEWCLHIANHLLLVQGLNAIVNAACLARLKAPNRFRPLHVALSCFIHRHLHAYALTMVTEWIKARRDDVVGAFHDGYWPSELRVSIFVFVCLLIRLSTHDACKYVEGIQVDRVLKAKPVAELLRLLRQRDLPAQVAQSLQKWYFDSQGVFVHSSLRDSLSPASHTAAGGADTPPQWPLQVLKHRHIPSNTSLDSKNMSMTLIVDLLRTCRLHQDSLQWTPFLGWFVTHYLVTALAMYLDKDPGFAFTELTEEDLSEDVFEPSPYHTQFWRVRPVVLEYIERWVLYWMSWNHVHATLTISSSSHPTTPPTVTLAQQRKIIAQGLLNQYLNVLNMTKFRNTFRESFSAVMQAYLLRPGSVEEYIQEKSEIASKKFMDVLVAQRPAEVRPFLLLCFNEFTPFHTMKHALMENHAVSAHLDALLSNSSASATPTSGSSSSSSSSTAMLDPLIDDALKKQFYHQALPVLILQLLEVTRVQKAFSELISEEDAGGMLSVQAVIMNTVAERSRALYRDSLAQNSGVVDLDAVQQRVMEEQAASNRTRVLSAAGSVESSPGTKGGNNSAERTFLRRLFVICYANRCVGGVEDVQAGNYGQRLRGAVPPSPYWSTFFGDKQDGLYYTRHDDPWIAFVRGEYWVMCPQLRFFGTTRVYEQALMWYTANVKQMCLDEPAASSLFDPLTHPLSQVPRIEGVQ
jgi:hypothetical protein